MLQKGCFSARQLLTWPDEFGRASSEGPPRLVMGSLGKSSLRRVWPSRGLGRLVLERNPFRNVRQTHANLFDSRSKQTERFRPLRLKHTQRIHQSIHHTHTICQVVRNAHSDTKRPYTDVVHRLIKPGGSVLELQYNT